MKIIFCFLLILFFSICNAKEIYPDGCSPFPISGKEENAMLKTSKPSLLMLHNLTNADVWVTHPVKEPGASAGWTTLLSKDNWSALFLTEKQFQLSCIEENPGHVQQVLCKDVLAVCVWKNLTLSENDDLIKNTFWAGENMSLSELTAYLARSGFGF